MRKLLLIVSLLALSVNSFAGYADDLSDKELIKTAENFIAYSLKDPDSAKFRNVFVKKVENKAPNGKPIRLAVCGEVNGVNSFGAYSGYSNFAVSALGSTPKGGIDDGPRAYAYGFANVFCEFQMQ